MPWRFVGFLVLVLVVAGFVGLNLEQRTALSFGFAKVEEVPVIVALLVAFVVGGFSSLPFVIRGRTRPAARERVSGRASDRANPSRGSSRIALPGADSSDGSDG